MSNANHEEALQLAHMKREESNLARCYIDLTARMDVAREALKKIVAEDNAGLLGDPPTIGNVARKALAALNRDSTSLAHTDRA